MKKRTSVWSLIGTALVFSLLLAAPARAWRATYGMQVLQRIEQIKQLAQQVQMVRNQIQMVKSLASNVKGSLSGLNFEILNVYNQTMDVLKKTEAVTYGSDDLMNKFKVRYYDPKDAEGQKINDIVAAATFRQRQWKDTQEIYMQQLGVTAQTSKAEGQRRMQMLQHMMNTNGQVQALQVLGGMVTETNQLLARQHQDMAMLIDLLSSRERDKIDEELAREQLRKENYKRAAEAQVNSPGVKHSWE